MYRQIQRNLGNWVAFKQHSPCIAYSYQIHDLCNVGGGNPFESSYCREKRKENQATTNDLCVRSIGSKVEINQIYLNN